MLQQEAELQLREALITIAAEGDASTIMTLLKKCLERDIAAMLGPCVRGG